MDAGILRVAAEAAVKTEKLTGCPAELLLAQWALESNFGINAPGYNSFGFKSYPGGFGRQLLKSFEYFTIAERDTFLALGDNRTAEVQVITPDANGRLKYQVRDWFAVFESTLTCFLHRAARFEAGRHLPFVEAYFQTKSLPDLFLGVARSGYDTAIPEQYAAALLDRSRRPEIIAALAAARQGNLKA